MNKIIILILLITYSNLSAQKSNCESKEEQYIDIQDFNSIAKCTMLPQKKNKKSKRNQITVKVTAPKLHFLKKKKYKSAKKVSALGKLGTKGINKTKQLAIAKKLILENNSKISKERLKNAIKFNVVENIPTFSNCENTSKEEKTYCFNTEMVKHIERHFTYPEKAILHKIEGEVWVRFLINEDGSISNIKAVNGAQILKDEAIRVVSLLPKFTAGKNDNKKVAVKYGFPITFSLKED